MREDILTTNAQGKIEDSICSKTNTIPLPVNLRYYGSGGLTPEAHISYICPHCKAEGRCIDDICYKCGKLVEFPKCKICGGELRGDYDVNIHKCWEDRERVTVRGGLVIFDLDKHQVIVGGQFRGIRDFLSYLLGG